MDATGAPVCKGNNGRNPGLSQLRNSESRDDRDLIVSIRMRAFRKAVDIVGIQRSVTFCALADPVPQTIVPCRSARLAFCQLDRMTARRQINRKELRAVLARVPAM
jgi:hypothetical protein